MVQSKWVTQVILTEELWRGLHEAAERLSHLHGERWSLSAVARQCITMALPVLLDTITQQEELAAQQEEARQRWLRKQMHPFENPALARPSVARPPVRRSKKK